MNKRKSRRVLLLTYAFSPSQAPESFLSAKLLSGLDSYTVDVLTLDYSRLGVAIDSSLNGYVKEKFGNVYRLKPPNWINRRVFNILRYVSFFPDKFSVFNNLICKEAVNINVESYDGIISWSQWHSIHLAALRIKNKFPSLPWVAHLSDPWADNPFLTKFYGYYTVQKFFEKKVIRYADSVNFTTDLTRSLVMRKYPEDWINKTYVTPHSYDLSLYGSNNSVCNDRLTVAYFGNFYGPRNPIRFLKALEFIYKADQSFFDDVSFQFIGKWVGNEDWGVDNIDLPRGLVNIESLISYGESLDRMLDVDLLLILDAPFDVSVFFPSKLVDYIGARKPILAVTPKGSCADIVREVGGVVCSPKSVQSIQDGVVLAINALRKEMPPHAISDDVSRFSNDFVSKQYEILLDQAIEG